MCVCGCVGVGCVCGVCGVCVCVGVGVWGEGVTCVRAKVEFQMVMKCFFA